MNFKYDELTQLKLAITPELAQEMLTHNKNNRKLSKNHVDDIIESIEKYGWKENNDAICFDIDGNLTNGQHRLNAIVKMGITTPETFVKLGMEKESYGFMDNLKRRSAADTCRYKYPEIAHLSSTVKTLDAFCGAKNRDGNISNDFATGKTNDEKVDYAYEHQGLAALALHIQNTAGRYMKRAGCQVALISAVVTGGMTLEDLDAFIGVGNDKFLNKNKYNEGAVTHHIRKLAEKESRSAGSCRKKEEEEWEKVIYMFKNNVNSIRKREELYPCTKETIKAADEKLKKELNKGDE